MVKPDSLLRYNILTNELVNIKTINRQSFDSTLFPRKLSLIVTPTNHIVTLALVYFYLAKSDVSYRRYLQLAVCSPNMVFFVNSNYIINAPIRD